MSIPTDQNENGDKIINQFEKTMRTAFNKTIQQLFHIVK